MARQKYWLPLAITLMAFLTITGCVMPQSYTNMQAIELMQKGKHAEAAKLQEKDLVAKEQEEPQNIQEMISLWTEANMLLMSYEALGRYHDMLKVCKRFIARYPNDKARMKDMSVGFIGGGSLRPMYEQQMSMFHVMMYGHILRAYDELHDYKSGNKYAAQLAGFLDLIRPGSHESSNAYMIYTNLFFYYLHSSQIDLAGKIVNKIEKQYRIVYRRNSQGFITKVDLTPISSLDAGQRNARMSAKQRREYARYEKAFTKMLLLNMITRYHLKLKNYREAEGVETARLEALQDMQNYLDRMSHAGLAYLPKAQQDKIKGQTKAGWLGQYGQIIEILVKSGNKQEALQRARSLERDFNRYGKYASMHEAYLWYSYKGMADAFRVNAEHAKAVQWYRKALERIELVRGGLMSFQEKILYSDSQDELYDALISSALASGDVATAFEYAERARARGFLDILGARVASARDDKSKNMLAKRDKLAKEVVLAQVKLGDQKNKTGVQMSRGGQPQADSQAAVRGLIVKRRQLAKVERDMSLQYPELAATVTIEVLPQAKLRKMFTGKERLVEYQVGQDETQVFVLGLKVFKGYRLPVGRRELEQLVKTYRTQIRNRADGLSTAQKLYDILVKPVSGDLKDVDRICIVPHGVLHYLPFGALHDGRKYLIETHTVHYSPSANVLRYCRMKPRPKDTRFLAVGNPDLGDPALSLPYAQREAEALAASHKNSLLLLGKAATVPAFKTKAPACGLIHLAAHGEYDPVNPLASGLLLSGAKGEKPNLTAGMVFKMELNADMVTLSGCQTALGKTTKGDEVIGLSRAFIYAGTPSVVSSLWKVADDSTALLMTSFYAGLNSGDKAKALAQAQRSVMKQHPHPFHWAAFTLIGDWK